MIQRIQSFYLVLVIAISGTLFFLPLSEKVELGTDGTQVRHELSISHFETKSGEGVVQQNPVALLLVFNLLVMGCTAYTIFTYKKRPRQIRLTMINGLLSIVLLILVFYYSENMGTSEQRVHYLAGVYLIPIQIFLLLAARRSIMRDERLIRAADRIR